MTSPRIAEQADAAGGAETPVVTGQDALDDLVALLDLERLEVNLFRGFSPAHSPTRVFGGQVAGQALVAAGRTVDPDRVVHSLHAYFVRPGDPRRPIIFDVERIRDGRSFTTRRVRAVQHGEVIFALAASFQLTQSGCRAHRARSRPGSRRRRTCPTSASGCAASGRSCPGVPRPLDLRFVEAPLWSARRGPATDEPQRVWMRADGTLPDDPMLHVCLLTYASDLTLLASVLAPHAAAHGPGRPGEPGPRDVVPPPVPGRRVAALRVPLAERGRRARARDRPVLHPRRPAGGQRGAGGPGPGHRTHVTSLSVSVPVTPVSARPSTRGIASARVCVDHFTHRRDRHRGRWADRLRAALPHRLRPAAGA